MSEVLIIGMGAFIGANLRYLIARLAIERYGSAFPYGTFLINVTGSMLIGIALGYVLERGVQATTFRLFFVVGLLGAYTTFSSYSYEAYAMLNSGAWFRGLAYLAGSVLLGMIAVTLGMLAGRRLA
jgi:CrcB protein